MQQFFTIFLKNIYNFPHIFVKNLNGKKIKSKKFFILFIIKIYIFIIILLNNLKYTKAPNTIDTNIYTLISSSKKKYIEYNIIQNIITKYIISWITTTEVLDFFNFLKLLKKSKITPNNNPNTKKLISL